MMDNLLGKISISVDSNVYVKDPESSELGKQIIRGSIDLIDKLGFEEFTFRKLAAEIKSTEASVYRYFTNKHYLLSYLTMWYWGWQEYRLTLTLMNIEDPEERLRRALRLITEDIQEDTRFLQVNEVKLDSIIRSESSKIYLNKSVDDINSAGVFKPFKDLVERISEIITEIAPDYKYPHMLVSTIIEGAQHQRYFAEHLPRLTDIIEGEDAVYEFYMEMVNKILNIDGNK